MIFSAIGPSRIESQQLNGTKFKTASEIVSWFGAVQAQEYEPTKWGLGLRLPQLNNSDIEKEISTGKILRTHLLRPTWHFVNANDIRWLLSLTAPRVHAANAYMYRKLELEDKLFKRCNAILEKTLQGGQQLTREALNEQFRKEKIIAEGHRLSYLMMQAELEGIVCSGAKQGNQFTYALLEELVPWVKQKNAEESLAELTKRYFNSRGPAMVKDFSTWSGLTLKDCKKGIELVNTDLKEERIGKEVYYVSADFREPKKISGELYLLPIYDEFIMGYIDRTALFEYRNSIHPLPGAQFNNMIVMDGQIIGTWKRTVHSKRIDLGHQFFKPLHKAQKIAFEKALFRLKEFTST